MNQQNEKQGIINKFTFWLKKNSLSVFFILNTIIFFSSRREDLSVAWQLLMLCELMAFLEAIYIIANIFKKFVEHLLQVVC